MFCFFIQKNYSQLVNSYTVGVNSLGDYGIKMDRGNDNTMFSFSYSSINSFNTTTNKSLFFTQPGSINMGMMGMTFEKRKPLTAKLDLFYGTEVNMMSNIYKNSNLTTKPNGNYLPNLSLNVGMKYKFTENISLSATIIQGYGYGLNSIMGNSLFNNDYSGLFNNGYPNHFNSINGW
jgi:hypothetical protein